MSANVEILVAEAAGPRGPQQRHRGSRCIAFRIPAKSAGTAYRVHRQPVEIGLANWDRTGITSGPRPTPWSSPRSMKRPGRRGNGADRFRVGPGCGDGGQRDHRVRRGRRPRERSKPMAARPRSSRCAACDARFSWATAGRGAARVDLQIGAASIWPSSVPRARGKSTLMNILGGLDTPTAGQYLLDGDEVQDLSDDGWPRSATARSALCFRASTCCPAPPP